MQTKKIKIPSLYIVKFIVEVDNKRSIEVLNFKLADDLEHFLDMTIPFILENVKNQYNVDIDPDDVTIKNIRKASIKDLLNTYIKTNYKNIPKDTKNDLMKEIILSSDWNLYKKNIKKFNKYEKKLIENKLKEQHGTI